MSGGGSEAGEELNLIPYLDIMVNLVIFLIFSFQIVVEMVRIELLSPAYGGAAGSSGGDENKMLTVVVTNEGYTLLSVDPSVRGQETVPLKGTKHDVDALHAKLVELKDMFHLGNAMILTAESGVPYKTIVETMDAARTDGAIDLFPDVLLARSGPAVSQ